MVKTFSTEGEAQQISLLKEQTTDQQHYKANADLDTAEELKQDSKAPHQEPL
jgi:hypothetical protein